MTTGKSKAGSRVSPLVVVASAVAIAVTYGAGFMRTRAAAERLTHSSSRRPTVDRADVQKALDMARFTTAPQPTIGANPESVDRITGLPRDESSPASSGAPPTASPQTGTPSMPARVSEPGPTPTTSKVAGAHTSEPSKPAVAEHVAPDSVFVPAASPDVAQALPAVPPVTQEPPAAAPPAAPRFKDGSFTGWGYCRHGEIQATITIQGGRIVDAEITQCNTRYSCDWIAKLPPQVVSRQSAEVDFVSGATESADAFYYAVEDALKKAK